MLSLQGCGTELAEDFVATTELHAPEARFAEGFSNIVGVRELSNGKVLVVDGLEQRVLLLAADFREAEPIGRPGQGPGEYELITGLLTRSDGNVGVYQAFSARLLEVSGAGETGETLYPGRCTNGAVPLLREIRWSDQNGFYYGEAAPVRGVGSGVFEVADSMAIERWREPCSRDTIAFIPNERFSTNAVVVAGMVLEPGARALPFAARWQWVVSDDGVVAIVEHSPYRVRFLHADGREVVGPVVQIDEVPVDDRLKEFWRARRLSMGEPPSEPTSWPATLPPFTVEDQPIARFAPDGDLWIRRTVTPNEAPMYDVFDDTGVLRERIRMPDRTRVVGFGTDAVYAVQADDVDLQYLVRFRTP